MKFNIKDKTNYHLVTIEGELDVYNVPGLSEKVKEMIENGTIKKVVFDLTEVIYIDSSGLGFFMATLKMLTSRSGKLYLIGLKKEIKKIFEFTQIIDFFSIYETVADCLEKESL